MSEAIEEAALISMNAYGCMICMCDSRLFSPLNFSIALALFLVLLAMLPLSLNQPPPLRQRLGWGTCVDHEVGHGLTQHTEPQAVVSRGGYEA